MNRFAHVITVARTPCRVLRLLVLLAVVPCLFDATPHLHRCDAPHDHGAPQACFCAPCECPPCFHDASTASLVAAPPALRKRCAPRLDVAGRILAAPSCLHAAAVAALRRVSLLHRVCARAAAVLRL